LQAEVPRNAVKGRGHNTQLTGRFRPINAIQCGLTHRGRHAPEKKKGTGPASLWSYEKGIERVLAGRRSTIMGRRASSWGGSVKSGGK